MIMMRKEFYRFLYLIHGSFHSELYWRFVFLIRS